MPLERIKGILQKEFFALITDTITLFAIRVLAAIIAYLTQVLLARWLGAEELGIFVYALSWLWILGLLATLGLASAANRFIPQSKTEDEFALLKGYLHHGRKITLLFASTVALVAITSIQLFFPNIPLNSQLNFLVAFLALPFLALTSFHSGIARAQLWFFFAALTGVFLRPFLLLLAIVLSMRLGAQPTAWFVMSLLFAIAILIAAMQYYIIDRRLHHKLATVKPIIHSVTWLHIAVPIMLTEVFVNFFIDVNIIVSGAFISPTEIAIYNAALRTVAIIAFGISSVGFVIAPRAAKLYAQGDKVSLQRLVTRASHLMFWPSVLAFLSLILLGNWILSLFGPGFSSAYTTLLVAGVTQVIIAASGPLLPLLNVTGHQHRCLKVFLIALLSTPLLYWLLMPTYGMLGGAIAYLLISVFWITWLNRIVVHHIGIQPSILNISNFRGNEKP